MSKARPNSQGDGPPCTGGAGVRGFSWPAVRRSFYLSNNAVGAVLPPAGQVFYCELKIPSVITYSKIKVVCWVEFPEHAWVDFLILSPRLNLVEFLQI